MKIRSILVIGLVVASIGLVGCSSADDFKEGMKDGYSKAMEENGGKYETQNAEIVDITENVDNKTLVVKLKSSGDLVKGSTMQDIKKLSESIDLKKFETLDVWVVADMENGKENKVLSATVDKDTIEKIQSGELKYAGKIEEAIKDTLWIKE